MANENQPIHKTLESEPWRSRKDADDPDFFPCVLLLTALFKPEIYDDYRRSKERQREENRI